MKMARQQIHEACEQLCTARSKAAAHVSMTSQSATVGRQKTAHKQNANIAGLLRIAEADSRIGKIQQRI